MEYSAGLHGRDTQFDYILQPGAQPLPTVTQGNTLPIGFNIPIFFWIDQREDVHSAQHSLQAARYGRKIRPEPNRSNRHAIVPVRPIRL